MITVYGLTDEHGQIRYVGQTANPTERFKSHLAFAHAFQVSGFATLAEMESDSDACEAERKWIAFFGRDNLHNRNDGPFLLSRRREVNTSKIYVRVTNRLLGKLIEDAGDMSTVSTVVRTILEKYYRKGNVGIMR